MHGSMSVKFKIKKKKINQGSVNSKATDVSSLSSTSTAKQILKDKQKISKKKFSSKSIAYPVC